ncbi:MAG: homoserine kinase [Ideonella sp.]|nr:homoserine kinase [Ideonella sp.]MCC7456358.1 homoserine kinase [Nitrospira sp.]
MAVFTELAVDEVRVFATQLRAGELLSLEPIRSGIENTNYFVATGGGAWVLTVFERLTHEQLPFYLRLMQHLARRGLPVPEPQADAHGTLVHTLRGKPAALCTRLAGRHLEAPDAAHAAALGDTLAQLHLAAADFELVQPNLRGLPWWQATAPRVRAFLAPDAARLLGDELAFQQQLAASAAYARLPRAAVHADLFRDNVLFDDTAGGDRLSGCIDFYFAGVDTLLFDLAVCVNDWCLADDSGRIDDTRAAALLDAYGRRRPLTATEHRLFPALLRAAALRFWLSRLADLHLPRGAALLQPKDPQHFERLLRERVAQPWHPR